VLSAAGVFGADKADQELNYSTVVICFQVAYALGMLAAGKIIDKVGTKSGYAWSLIGWSIAAIGHAFGHHTWSFGIWRAALGVTEAGNFPAANKTIAEWFPKKERAFATGLYNSGANVGAIVAPMCVPLDRQGLGLGMGVHSHRVWWAFTWLVFWYSAYMHRPRPNFRAANFPRRNTITSTATWMNRKPRRPMWQGQSFSWFKLLTFRQTWAFVVGKFMTDPVWWFFLFWLPAFLNGRKCAQGEGVHGGQSDLVTPVRKSDIPGRHQLAVRGGVVYTVSTVGSIFGGWLPKKFINGGMDANKARKLPCSFLPCSP
jgi:ACS family hexuronate transporter-like MFS transporter